MANVCQYGGEPKGNGTQECNCKEYTGYYAEIRCGRGPKHTHRWANGTVPDVQKVGYRKNSFGAIINEKGNCNILDINDGNAIFGYECSDESRIVVEGECKGKSVYINGNKILTVWNDNVGQFTSTDTDYSGILPITMACCDSVLGSDCNKIIKVELY